MIGLSQDFITNWFRDMIYLFGILINASLKVTVDVKELIIGLMAELPRKYLKTLVL